MTLLRFGPRLEPDGGATFRLWAPAAREVRLLGDRSAPMVKRDAWFEASIPGARPGFAYRFEIDGEIAVPDPASHYQPDDVNGPSELIAHDFNWRCTNWKGRPWEEAVILELHIGTFTPEGTYRAAIERLDDLVATGITAIELMPLADFAGKRNWGYDGVLLYAPDSAYGRPEDLKALVDAAHARGLMVFLDVVYNHFGPEGNFLPRYAPAFFTDDQRTPWGDAIDFRVEEVRAFAVDNVRHWLTNYRFDGLRFDAVHAIKQPGEPSILRALSEAAGEIAAESGRQIHLMLENDDNAAAWLDPNTAAPTGRYRAQWNDDYHHAWHVLLTGEKGGYYVDYAHTPFEQVARCLQSGFAYQGDVSAHRGNAPRGEASAHLPASAFVNFLQNHDQIGNRAHGDRLITLADPRAFQAALAITLLAPSVPLLFMGDEWGCERPFPFFCDFPGDLAEAVRRGRKAEFAAQFTGLSTAAPIPDPLCRQTFQSAVLDWSERASPPYAERLAHVRELLAARRRCIAPRLRELAEAPRQVRLQGRVLVGEWGRNPSELRLLANLSDTAAATPNVLPTWEPVWGGAPPAMLPPWSVYWGLGAH